MKFIDSNGLSHLWTIIKEYVASAVNTVATTVGGYTVNGKKISTNPTLAKADVGLGNVTNDAQVKRTEMGAASGVATLGTDGKLTAAQLPALKTINGTSVVGSGNIAIDLSLYKVVTSLPTTGIDATKIYLVLSGTKGTQNNYTEYIYTGDTAAAYNAGKWEKLGEYKAAVDLTPYVKFTDLATASKAGAMSASDKKKLDSLSSDALRDIAFNEATAEYVELMKNYFSGGNLEIQIPAATGATAGVMSAADKVVVDEIANIADSSVGGGILRFGTQCDAGGTYIDITIPYTMDSGDGWDNGDENIRISAATTTLAGVMTAADKAKLNGIATGATADSALTEAEIDAICV